MCKHGPLQAFLNSSRQSCSFKDSVVSKNIRHKSAPVLCCTVTESSATLASVPSSQSCSEAPSPLLVRAIKNQQIALCSIPRTRVISNSEAIAAQNIIFWQIFWVQYKLKLNNNRCVNFSPSWLTAAKMSKRLREQSKSPEEIQSLHPNTEG